MNQKQTIVNAYGVVYIFDSNDNLVTELTSISISVDPNSIESFIITWDTFGKDIGKSLLPRMNWLKGEEGFLMILARSLAGLWNTEGGPQSDIQWFRIFTGKFNGNLSPAIIGFPDFILGAVQGFMHFAYFFFSINWHGENLLFYNRIPIR